MKKRILPLLLTLALCASLLTPALAAETVTITKSDPINMPMTGMSPLTLTGVLSQEESNWQVMQSVRGDTVQQIHTILYTLDRNFTSKGSATASFPDGWTLNKGRGYSLTPEGIYAVIGDYSDGEYYFYDDTTETGLPEKFVTQEEFFSKCDLVRMGTTALSGEVGLVDIWARFEGSTIPTAPTVAPSSCAATLDGKAITLNAYLFTEGNGGTNYVMLRDVASLLNGSKAQFEVTWDKDKGIILTTGQAYTPVGGEMQGKGESNKPYTANASTITIDGKAVELTAYTIEGNNYFKLRDLGTALGFGVDWDGASGTVIIDTTAN